MDQQPISATTSTMMIVIAAVFDALQMLLSLIVVGALLNWAVTVFAGLVFYLWFKMHGVNFLTARRFGTAFGFGLMEFVPILNVLPGWTAAIILNILYSRWELAATKVATHNDE